MGKERLIEVGRLGLRSTKELIKNNKAVSLGVGLSGGLVLSGLALQAVTEFDSTKCNNSRDRCSNDRPYQAKIEGQSKGRGRSSVLLI